MGDTAINVPSSSSQPSTQDTNTGNISAERGEITKNIGAANADVIVMSVKQFFDPGD
jgi:hypothetical protein